MDDPRTPRRTCTRRRPRWLVGTALVTSLGVLGGCTAGAAPRAAGTASASGTGLFDDTAVHDIDVELDQDAYDAMIETFGSTGEKEWITATVTLDGQVFEDVGMRLKGNSSLAGLSGDGGRGPMGDASADEPESLPWLVRLDENVEGQSFEGLTEFVIRSNASETSLNEAVALELVGLAGLATQEAASTRLSVNGSEERLRLVVENPDEEWEDRVFDTEGVLYKAEAGGDYSYRGDDPAAYDEVFDQETGDEDDLTPLVRFLEFINDSDDETFAEELADHLDVDAFATYLAVQELIGNEDDIDGPGNNSYLRYDAESGRFVVVTWDLNLAFGGLGAAGGRGGGGDGGPPAGMEPPEDGQVPEGFEPPEDGQVPERPERGAGGSGGSNVLVERFLADETFAALYETALTELRATLYDSGEAQAVLDRWSALLTEGAADVVDADVVAEEAQAIADFWAADAASGT